MHPIFGKSGGNLYKLRDIIHPKPAVKEHEILDIFTRRQNWKRQSDAPINRTTVIPTWQSYSKYYSLRQSTVIPNYRILPKSNISMAQCRALAPVPPAPFTPRRRIQNRIPRHQPCLVHVNQSKWTCQKNLPSVIYETTPIYTVVPPRGFGKTKGMGRSGGEKRQKRQTERFDVCGKKASQSMRTISKPTDQCHSRHFSKFTPRRKHIAYKAPLPCKVPTYKPTMPKQSFKPSSDDWHQQRSLHRAQLRSRA
uniref:Uncharacterized protein n=1 Tax=Caenorhabditis tropicalis TaxID=1561998 RepID=A0A1I7UZL7_9PELO